LKYQPPAAMQLKNSHLLTRQAFIRKPDLFWLASQPMRNCFLYSFNNSLNAPA
jgi:hypothetical protein